MAQTSIHFQAVKGGSEQHNKREKFLDYVFEELTYKNEYWEKDTQENRLEFCKQNAKEKTGRKMQAKATPIREAVVVIDEFTTMDDLKNLSDRFLERFGIDVFQIAIHKDEGYINGKDKKLNLHAHLVVDWTDHNTGKSLKLDRNDMAEMQTITAEVLQMERGVSSERKHLSAMQYKAKAEEARAEENEGIARWEIMRGNQARTQLDDLNFEILQQKIALESIEKQKRDLFFRLTDARNELKAINGALKEQKAVREQKNKEFQSFEGRLTELEQQVRRGNAGNKLPNGRGADAYYQEKRGDIYRNIFYSFWKSAKDAVNVLCKYLYYKHLNVSFSREEVKTIDNAMKSATTIAERETYGKDLVWLANAEYPGYDYKETRIEELNWKVREIARKENTYQQSQSRGRGMGY